MALTRVGYERIAFMRFGDLVLVMAGSGDNRIEAKGKIVSKKPFEGLTGLKIQLSEITFKGDKSEFNLVAGDTFLAALDDVYTEEE